MKKIIIIGGIIMAAPFFVHAQNENEKAEKKELIEKQEKKELKEKKEIKEMETIVITRNGDTKGKTVIEIDGDKVKVNGKDAEDNKDVTVNVHRMKTDQNFFGFGNGFNGNSDNMTLFSEDANKAMLGVVTENDDKGAQIQSITRESAAEKAGLKKGDIITRIGDEKIDNADDVSNIIHDHKPGDKVRIEILRDGKEQSVTAELGKWKGIKMNSFSMPPMEEFNLKMEDMNHNLENMHQNGSGNWNVTPVVPPMKFDYFPGSRPKLGLSIEDTEDGKGVKILDVEEESNAAKAGLEKDDIITRIDDKEIKGTEDVTRMIRERKDKNGYSFNILRDGKSMTVQVKIPRKLKTADL